MFLPRDISKTFVTEPNNFSALYREIDYNPTFEEIFPCKLDSSLQNIRNSSGGAFPEHYLVRRYSDGISEIFLVNLGFSLAFRFID